MRLGTLLAGVFMLLFGVIAVAAVYVVWPTAAYYAQFFAGLPMNTIKLLAIAPGAVLIVMGVLLLIFGAVLPSQPQMPTAFPYQHPFYPQAYAPIPSTVPPTPYAPPTMLLPAETSLPLGPKWCYQCGHLVDRAPSGEWYCPRCGIRV